MSEATMVRTEEQQKREAAAKEELRETAEQLSAFGIAVLIEGDARVRVLTLFGAALVLAESARRVIDGIGDVEARVMMEKLAGDVRIWGDIPTGAPDAAANDPAPKQPKAEV